MLSLTFRRSTRGLVAALAAAALLLASVAPALAQNSVGGYKDQGGQVQEQVEGVGATGENNPGAGTRTGRGGDRSGSAGNDNSPTTAPDRGSNTLPFTGLETALILTMGAALTGLGVGLRRVAREPS